MATPGPGLSLIPENGAARTALAQRLACWAKQANGMTDPRIKFLTCKGIGYYYIPPVVCTAGYGPFPFTSEGNEIICDPEATHQMDRTIWPEDVMPIDPNTCTTEDLQLATPWITAVTPGDGQVVFSWDTVPGAASYNTRYKTPEATEWTDGPVVPAPASTATVTGLTNGQEYLFQVQATSPDYMPSWWSVSVSATPSGEPVPGPTGLATSNIGPASVQLTWDAVEGAESYTLYYKPSAESVWMVAGQTTPPTVSATVSSLTSSTAYDFAVGVTVGGEMSAPSTPVSATTIAGGTPLEQVTAAAGTPTATSVPLTWADDADASSFQIRWRAASEEQWNPVLGTEDAGATGTSMEGLQPSTAYVFGVRAVGDGTTFTSGPWSADVTATTAAAGVAAASKRTARKRT